MKALTTLGLALTVLLAFSVSTVSAAEQTLNGTIVCAKCKLKKSDATECQDVLLVKAQEATAEYYVTKNDVSSKFGHVCGGDAQAIVTGEVTEKDGKKWITPSKMEKPA